MYFIEINNDKLLNISEIIKINRINLTLQYVMSNGIGFKEEFNSENELTNRLIDIESKYLLG